MWVYWVLLILVTVLSIAMAPRPKNAKPPSLEDFSDMPGVEDGVEITDVGGMAWIPNSNMLWYGNLRTTPIKAKGGK